MKIARHLSRANLTAHLRELARGQPAGMRRASDNTLSFCVIFVEAAGPLTVILATITLTLYIGHRKM